MTLNIVHTAIVLIGSNSDELLILILFFWIFEILILLFTTHQTPYSSMYVVYLFSLRLQESDNCWWDSFANEFFEDEAQLTLTFCLEDGPKRYSELSGGINGIVQYLANMFHFYRSKTFIAAIGRTLIPRYFRSIFEGGVTELYYNLKHSKESFHNTSITLDCEQCTMVTHHSKPMYTKVSF